MKSNIISQFLDFSKIIYQELNDYSQKMTEKPVEVTQKYLKWMAQHFGIKLEEYIDAEEDVLQVLNSDQLELLLQRL